ncbi:hypothetical protein H6A18_09445 [Collinsella tanakaei]|uniref:hypothetical protein n=1 Tax=Collinsella tanakaei TaxID=626935 RepID=UPI00195C1F3C|nr:hypothetical protein [Collinsella tanakaei]MBM6756725.1 hypothetical protein [Collinsella tanakaei]
MDSPSKIRYDKKNLVRVNIAFNRKTNPEAVAKMEELERAGESKSAYIKAAVQEKIDCERAQEGKE